MTYTQDEKKQRKQFAADVIKGLTSHPKKLSSKYFYDGTGSKLFRLIMELPEYYLTRTETEIFRTQCREIIYSLLGQATAFNLIDLGAGDAAKTRLLLRELLQQKIAFTYVPVDISADALEHLQTELQTELPHLQVRPLASEYFAALDWLSQKETTPKVVFFLGSNIGNFETKAINHFTQKLRQYLQPQDKVFIGFDLQKDPHVIRQAYDDAAGITAAFNFNLLHRINQEFTANFNPEYFQHFAEYNPVTGNMKSYLLSTKAQKIYLADLNQEIAFQAWEAIHTETSHKFTLPEIEQLGQSVGLKINQIFTDPKHYFADVLFEVV
ncbi:MAG: L-histidine N(alpha)-methyltransferase [Adhaeribacter sp.]